MKIERLSENQIRCTLNKADLSEKQLKISELAYGSPKARALFKDMMEQASVELGFEADDTPLMIEAVPVSPDCLVMIVTKVEDPEELDTRFSRFSGTSAEYDIDDDDDYDDDYDSIDDVDDMSDIEEGEYAGGGEDTPNTNSHFARIEISDSSSLSEGFREALEGLFSTLTGIAGRSSVTSGSLTTDVSDSDNQTAAPKKTDGNAAGGKARSIYSLFVFDSLDTVINASKQVASFYFSDNCLYKNPADNEFYLVVTNSQSTQKEFSRVCSILAEYGKPKKLTYAMPAYFREHFTAILTEDAIQTISAI